MNEKTVLFYGTPDHPTLEPLYQHLRQRACRRVVFVVQEDFPRDVGISLGAGQRDPSGFLVPPHEEPIPLDSICGVCLDRFYVDARGFDDLDESDVTYARSESWATLVALFGRLSQTCVVANHVTRPDLVGSRAASLAFLATCAISVPRVLVTSDTTAAREFYARHGERTLYQPASSVVPRLKPMRESDLERFDAIRLAPVHFEEAVVGTVARCVIAGTRSFVRPDGVDVPPDFQALCLDVFRQLDLHFGEISLCLNDQDGCVATGMHTHLSPNSVWDPEILDAASTFLEEGAA